MSLLNHDSAALVLSYFEWVGYPSNSIGHLDDAFHDHFRPLSTLTKPTSSANFLMLKKPLLMLHYIILKHKDKIIIAIQ